MVPVMDPVRTQLYIKAEEGTKLVAYKDSLGIWTIGTGHNLIAHGYSPANAAKVVWSQAQADTALREDIQEVVSQLWPWALALDDVRCAVLVSMAFQLGVPGLAKFKRTLKAIQAGNYNDAALFMAESLWAKQTPARAKRAIMMMISGEWPAQVNGVKIA